MTDTKCGSWIQYHADSLSLPINEDNIETDPLNPLSYAVSVHTGKCSFQNSEICLFHKVSI